MWEAWVPLQPLSLGPVFQVGTENVSDGGEEGQEPKNHGSLLLSLGVSS